MFSLDNDQRITTGSLSPAPQSIIREKILLIIAVFLFICPGTAIAVENGTSSADPDTIIIDPIADQHVGDIIFINGTTNIPPAQNISLGLDTYCNVFRPHMKTESGGIRFTISDIPVRPGRNGINRWSVNITDFILENFPGTHCQGRMQGSNETHLWYQCDPECDHWMVFNDSDISTDFYIFEQNRNLTNGYSVFGYQARPAVLGIPVPPIQLYPLHILLVILGVIALIVFLYGILGKIK